MRPPTDAMMHRAYAAAGRPVPPEPPGLLPGEMFPDTRPGATPRPWRVRAFTLDGTRIPVTGDWVTCLPGEALQRTVQQARADGWPVAALRWSVLPLPHEATP